MSQGVVQVTTHVLTDSLQILHLHTDPNRLITGGMQYGPHFAGQLRRSWPSVRIQMGPSYIGVSNKGVISQRTVHMALLTPQVCVNMSNSPILSFCIQVQ